MLGVGHEHVEVGDRAADALVEDLIGGGDRGGARGAFAQAAAGGTEAGEEGAARGADAVAGAAADFEKEGLTGGRGEVDVEGGLAGAEAGGSGLELESRLAQPVVEAGVGEGDGVGFHRRRVERAAAGALGAADLEDVGEVGGEGDGEAEAVGLRVVVADRQPLEGAGVPEEAGAVDVDEVLCDQPLALGAGNLGIREVADEHRVVVADGGAEEQRPVTVHREVEVREIAGIAVVDALWAARAGKRVAVVVEDGEGVGVLHRPRPPLLQRGGDRNKELRQVGRNGRRSDLGFGLHRKPSVRR